MQPYSRYVPPSMQQGINTNTVIANLEDDLNPIVEEQITQIITQIVEAIEDIIGIPIPSDLIDEFI